MKWKTPRVEEIGLGMEVTGYVNTDGEDNRPRREIAHAPVTKVREAALCDADE
jgi:coenzyme PQQ precursor peptide PqqA